MEFTDGIDSPAFNPKVWPDLYRDSGVQYAFAEPESFIQRKNLLNGALWHQFLSEISDLTYGMKTEGVWVCGGFFERIMNGQKPNDIDLFFKNGEAFRSILKVLSSKRHFQLVAAGANYSEEARVKFDAKKINGYDGLVKFLNANPSCRFVEFQNLKTGTRIQMVKAWYNETIEKTIDRFDLTVSQFGYDLFDGMICYNPVSLLDVVRKKLVLHRLHLPESTLKRIFKYQARGYEVCPGLLSDFIEITRQLALSGPPQTFGPGAVLYVD